MFDVWSPLGLSLLGLIWVVLALHTSLSMRSRRRWWVWFIICTLFSVVPAAVVAYVDYFRNLKARRLEERRLGKESAGPCPHCGADLGHEPVRRVAGRVICPGCGLAVGNEHLA